MFFVCWFPNSGGCIFECEWNHGRTREGGQVEFKSVVDPLLQLYSKHQHHRPRVSSNFCVIPRNEKNCHPPKTPNSANALGINTSNNNNSVSHATYSSITNDIEYGTSLDDMKLAAIRLALINCSCYATFCANNDGWCRQQYQNACQRMKFPALSFLPSSHFPLSLIWCN